ncbi:MAG: phenylalanine--tRNA ligase subunit beta [Anaerolineaceae bacterium]|nr:phenylalanine--tRNA ligase subunit beta [Anaerolineaceae bacterium]
MKLPLSWIKDYVDIDLSLNDLAHLLTMTGLEVEEVILVGLSWPQDKRLTTKFSGLSWDPHNIVVGQVDEVMPHPNADRLILCRLHDGQREHVVLTGAPNLFQYKGKGPLENPIKVAYAKEGAQIYDGHQPGQQLITLKRAKIRGVESYSMACSEKELGISDEHEGIIILDDDAPTGQPLVDYMGDAVFNIAIQPNMIRNSSVIGVAREIAAATGKPLHKPTNRLLAEGPSVIGQVFIEIPDPDLNPRFVLGLVRGVEAKPSPYWVQMRLSLAGMRPINSIVDATNYVMLEAGEPLHAFDYDVLVERAGGKPPTIITRLARAGETLTTLDNIERKLDDFTVLVTDTAGSLSLAGVMGGLESEVTENTRNVLLEGATWNFINTRRTVKALRLPSEAAYRFERGVHPALAPEAVRLGLDRMAEWSGGQIAADLVDAYPKPYQDPTVCISSHDVKRHLGIDLSAKEIADLLGRLEFNCRIEAENVYAKSPPFRLDIGEGIIGLADVMEEIARLYGFDNIPAKQLADALPLQKNNPALVKEEHLKDTLVNLGLQEVITYRLTTPERERQVLPPEALQSEAPYLWLENPISQERTVMRRSLLASVLESLERNSRQRDRLAVFEIGPVFLPKPDQQLPDEQWHALICMTGLRATPAWDNQQDHEIMDFYDLKGIVEAILDAMHIQVDRIRYEPAQELSFHPGKCALLLLDGEIAGTFGEIHPLVKENYDSGKAPILVADINLDVLLNAVPLLYDTSPVPVFPAVLEDIAVIVDEDVPAFRVEEVICAGGGVMLVAVQLFDIYRGEQIGEGKKSLAYSLAYQSPERTLNDKDASKIRRGIIYRLEKDLGAKLRS